MLVDESIAITKEKVLALIILWTVNPETAKIKDTHIKIVKIKTKIFFEYKSIPLIFAIASKFANLKALPPLCLRETKCIKIINGTTTNKNK